MQASCHNNNGSSVSFPRVFTKLSVTEDECSQTQWCVSSTTIHHSVDLCFFKEPRYASLPNIMKAKKKPVEKLTSAELGIDLTPRLETVKVMEPPKRVGGGKVIFFPFLVYSRAYT